MTRPFCWYQVQGHQSRSRSNMKVTVFKKKKANAGALVFRKHSLLQNVNCRLIYWTDWGAVPRIGRTDYDGLNQTVLVSEGIRWPNGLALDLKGKLYPLSYLILGRLNPLPDISVVFFKF